MRILLDTHFVIWLATDRTLLRPGERQMLEGDENEVLLSAISLWELRVKEAALLRRSGGPPPLTAHDAIAFARDSDLRIVRPYVGDYAARLAPRLAHTDPVDEMLLTHAQQLGARLLTRDDKLIDHPLALSL